MIGSIAISIDETCCERRLGICVDASAIFCLFKDNVDDAVGSSVEISDARIVGILNTLDLIWIEVGNARTADLTAIDLKNRSSAIYGDRLKRTVNA